jgi:hypothetical protein
MINCAHSATFDSPYFTLADFDYYFLYGRRSLESLRRNKHRFGSPACVLTGPVAISRERSVPWPKGSDSILYFSSQIRGPFKDRLLGQFEEVLKMASEMKSLKLLVRKHPLEDHDFWERSAGALDNVKVLPSMDIEDALAKVQFTLSPSCSSTPIDAALLGRVPLLADRCEFGLDYYSGYDGLMPAQGEPLAKFVARAMQAAHTMQDTISRLLGDSVAHPADSIQFAARVIESIHAGRTDFEFHTIGEAT